MTHTIKSILYAADLEEGSDVALAYGIDLANRLGANLHVLKVIPDLREKSLIEIDNFIPQEKLDEYHEERLQRAREHIEAQINAFYVLRSSQTPAHPITEIAVREDDDVADRVLAEAKATAADLIILGSRGGSIIAGILFRSAAQGIIRNSHVPVLLVPAEAMKPC
ncbi:universal stress protein [Methylopila sp. M107]|uniref:universal stress protein n=1 Tax=Methylopila sp. M107 TaxID=1101190 RepID=UPI00036EB2FA|nr:universal stress protein [Methylopila sp. M107]